MKLRCSSLHPNRGSCKIIIKNRNSSNKNENFNDDDDEYNNNINNVHLNELLLQKTHSPYFHKVVRAQSSEY